MDVHPLHALAGALCLICAVAVQSPRALAQNLVQNPGFEDTTIDQGSESYNTTTSPGWTLNNNPDSPYGTQFAEFQSPNSGSWAAQFLATNPQDAVTDTLSQVIGTTPMTYYTVSFFLSNSEGPENSFLATFGGQTVLSLSNADVFGYQQFSATIRATSDQSVLAFTGEQVPGLFSLDDVSVEAGPAPVAGGGIASFAVALAAFGFCFFRRKTTLLD